VETSQTEHSQNGKMERTAQQKNWLLDFETLQKIKIFA